MGISVRARLIPIGNSQGIRIPKLLLEEARLGLDLELSAEAGRLVIRSARRPREGWDEAFREMAARGDDELLDGDVQGLTPFDDEEWHW